MTTQPITSETVTWSFAFDTDVTEIQRRVQTPAVFVVYTPPQIVLDFLAQIHDLPEFWQTLEVNGPRKHEHLTLTRNGVCALVTLQTSLLDTHNQLRSESNVVGVARSQRIRAVHACTYTVPYVDQLPGNNSG